MRISIYCGYFLPHVGGYCTNIHELAKRLVESGNDVKIVTCNTENMPSEETMDGVYIVRLPAWDLFNKTFPVPKPCLSILKGWMSKPDVVITQTRLFPTSLLGAINAWLYPVPLIHVERGSCHSVVSGKLFSSLVRVYDHTCGTIVVKYARKNIGVSEAACEFVKHLGGKNRQVIFNGVEI